MFPAGTYVLMDPAHADLDLTPDTELDNSEIIKINGYEVFHFKTTYGAGGFPLMLNGVDLGKVDSDYGTLVLMPLELFNLLDEGYLWYIINNWRRTVINLATTTRDFTPTMINGVLHAGEITLDTNQHPGIDVPPGNRIERAVTYYVMLHLHYINGTNVLVEAN